MRFKIICAATLLLLLATKVTAVDSAVIRKEFVFESAPFASCHASTIAVAGTKSGFMGCQTISMLLPGAGMASS